MEIFFTILIMTLVVSLSGVVTRVMPFQIPLPLMQIAIGALLAWPTFGLHVEFDPELFLVLFIPPLLFADGWKTPTVNFSNMVERFSASRWRWWWSPWSALASLFTGWCRAFR